MSSPQPTTDIVPSLIKIRQECQKIGLTEKDQDSVIKFVRQKLEKTMRSEIKRNPDRPTSRGGRKPSIEGKKLTVTDVSKHITNYPGDLTSVPRRTFVRSGDLYMVTTPEKRDIFTFFLFSDLLVWCSGYPYKFKGEISLRRADVVTRSQRFSIHVRRQKPAGRKANRLPTIRDMMKNKQSGGDQSGVTDIKNAIQIITPDSMISVCGTSFDDRAVWLKDLEGIANQFYMTRVFGMDLQELLFKNGEANGIPKFIRMCFDFFNNDSLIKTEGLFRITAAKGTNQEWRNNIDDGLDSFIDVPTPHVVTGLMKMWFRQMPEPLIPYDLFDRMHTITEMEASDLQKVKELVKDVPEPNLSLLRELCFFLARVASFSEYNKMVEHNLSIMFQPNIMRKRPSGNDGLDMMSGLDCTALELMILHRVEVFGSTNTCYQLNPDASTVSPSNTALSQREGSVEIEEQPKVFIHYQSESGLHSFRAGLDETIAGIKTRLFLQENLPLEQQVIIFVDTELEDEAKTLQDYGVKADETLHLNMRVLDQDSQTTMSDAESLDSNSRPNTPTLPKETTRPASESFVSSPISKPDQQTRSSTPVGSTSTTQAFPDQS